MKIKTIFFASILAFGFFFSPLLWRGAGGEVFSQCLPMIKIDGNDIVADENHTAGLKLPTWLKTGQTLEKGQYVFSISVIEFTVNGTALDYSQNLSITTPLATVPAGKVWKIESIHKDATIAVPPPTTTYSTAGSYNFTPTCNGTHKIQVWGGGGGGGGGYSGNCSGNGGGGGGSGYSEGNFYLLASTTYAVTVGAGGIGGGNQVNGTAGTSSSVSIVSISATGGAGGVSSSPGAGGAGGTGSGGQINTAGNSGVPGSSSYGVSGKGGDSPNGGVGGNGVTNGGNGSAGNAPGAGGGGGASYTSDCGNYVGGSGAAGAAGKVAISMSTASSGGGGGGGGTPRDKLQASDVINASITTSCGYTVPSGRIFRLDGVTSATATLLYMGTSCGSQNRGAIYINNTQNSGNAGSASQAWPYPLWFVAGTMFYFSAGTAYINGMEFTIE